MKTAKLFKAMQNLVNKHVEHYHTDFGIDQKGIKNHPEETLYYWYLRDCGTFLASATDMQWIETGTPESAQFWLSRAKMIFEVHTDTQEIKSLTPSKMTSIIKAAKPMSELTKLDYILQWMSREEVIKNPRPSEILFYMARQYKFKHWKIDELIDTCPGITVILKALAELKAGALNDVKRERSTV